MGNATPSSPSIAKRAKDGGKVRRKYLVRPSDWLPEYQGAGRKGRRTTGDRYLANLKQHSAGRLETKVEKDDGPTAQRTAQCLAAGKCACCSRGPGRARPKRAHPPMPGGGKFRGVAIHLPIHTSWETSQKRRRSRAARDTRFNQSVPVVGVPSVAHREAHRESGSKAATRIARGLGFGRLRRRRIGRRTTKKKTRRGPSLRFLQRSRLPSSKNLELSTIARGKSQLP